MTGYFLEGGINTVDGNRKKYIRSFDMEETKPKLKRCSSPPPAGEMKKPKNDPEHWRLSLGNNKFFVIGDYQGITRFNLRIYDWSEEQNKPYPTKKGVSLDPEKWKKVQYLYCKDIDASISEVLDGKDIRKQIHLGENLYVTVKSGYHVVDFRRWFLPEGKTTILPTQRGISLAFYQWRQLKEHFDFVDLTYGSLLGATPYCHLTREHTQQKDGYCTRCNPNAFQIERQSFEDRYNEELRMDPADQ